MYIQKTQRWQGGKAKWQPPENLFDSRDYEVAELYSDKIAEQFLQQVHYLKTLPAARRKFGLYRGEKLVGVAVFAHPTHSNQVLNVFPIMKSSDALVLARFALEDSCAFNAESYMLARCFEILKRDFCGVISYSDDVCRTNDAGEIVFAGHLGIVYQATNALFVGRSAPVKQSLLPDGTVLHQRTLQKTKHSRRAPLVVEQLISLGADEFPNGEQARRAWLSRWLDSLTKTVNHPGTLRYVWNWSKTEIKTAALPYPKLKFSSEQGTLFTI